MDSALMRYFLSELEVVVLRCEAKYLGKRNLGKKVQKAFSGDEDHRDLSRIYERIQHAYSKWMVGFRTNIDGG